MSRPSFNAIGLVVLGLLVACEDDSTQSDPTDAATADVAADAFVPTDTASEGGDGESGQEDGGAIEGPGRWISLSLPESGVRQEHGVAALNGEVYIVGGFDARTIVASVEAYNPETDDWRVVASVPERMHHPNVAVTGGTLYVVGYLVELTFQAIGLVYAYDPEADMWSEVSEMPEGTERGASGVAVLDGRIYVAGGQSGLTTVTRFSAYDPEDGGWETLAPVPEPVNHLGAGEIDGTIYVVGGRQGGISGHTAALYAYDVERDEWEERAPMPTSRAGVAAAVVDGRLYVFGGEGNPNHESGVFDDAESYDPVADEWSILTPMPTRRHGTGAAAVDGIIYIPLGADQQSFGVVEAFEAFVPGPTE